MVVNSSPALDFMALIEEQELTKEQLHTMLRQMLEIREFEATVDSLVSRDIIKGASHMSSGQEAVPVGAVSALQLGDMITSTHRGHGHCHAHGDVHALTPEDKQTHLRRMMAELMGKVDGYCKGKGGSMHIADVAHGNLGATAIVGGNLPVAIGAALAEKLRGGGRVVVCFFGEGAANTGNFHESLNMASLWNLPVIFVCENNLYAMSVPWAKASKLPSIAHRASAYGIVGEEVDGMDVLKMRAAMLRAAERARNGEGPTLVEAKTYRWFGHSKSDARVYRTRDEENAWKQRDPIRLLSDGLTSIGWLTADEQASMEKAAEDALQDSVDYALASPQPTLEEMWLDIYVPPVTSQADVEAERQLRQRVYTDTSVRTIPYWQALNEAMSEEMERDLQVFLFGEDIGLYGGAYGATRGLLEKFGEWRVMDTPISEATIAGAGVGAAMVGMRPVVEIMYVDFTPLIMDQLANQGAKNRYMFGGKTSVPLVVRTQGGAGRALAAQHSQSLEALWTHFPGIYVVMPATPYDAKGLLKAAIRDNNPVLFIEHKLLYKTTGPVPTEDYIIPLGLADVKRTGKDVTLVTYSRSVLRALEAADILAKEGIDVEVIDLRSLKPLDTDTIIQSVKKTGRFVGVTEAYQTSSFISELMAIVNDLAFDYLDAPMVRVAAADVPVPRAEALEDACIPNVGRIIEGIRQVLA
jgi:pyruvate/2-oxoglutarate/acetoin dehydrogenase E1 component/TPP-dependent pyruvate/acetoin dehydrogenase alpha subunit